MPNFYHMKPDNDSDERTALWIRNSEEPVHQAPLRMGAEWTELRLHRVAQTQESVAPFMLPGLLAVEDVCLPGFLGVGEAGLACSKDLSKIRAEARVFLRLDWAPRKAKFKRLSFDFSGTVNNED